MSIRRLGGCLLQTTSLKPLLAEEWDAFVRLLVADVCEHGQAPCGIQYSVKRSPTATQLRALTDAISAQPEGRRVVFDRFAIVTRSALVRATLPLIRWKLRHVCELRAFAPGIEHEALAWLSARTPIDVDTALGLLRSDAIAVGGLEGAA